MKTKKTRRVVALLLAMAIAIGVTLPVAALGADAADVSNHQRFTDVPSDAWYAEAVNAMADAGVVNGVGDGKFEPNRPMTAGELAKVLWNLTYGDICDATELLMYGTYGGLQSDIAAYDPATNRHTAVNPNYSGPRFESVGKIVSDNGGWMPMIQLTTWDGPVSAAVYGDGYEFKPSGSDNYKSERTCLYSGNSDYPSQLTTVGSRFPGYSTYKSGNVPSSDWCARNMSVIDIAVMSKDYVTRGFAVSELVNVLRMTGNLQNYKFTDVDKYPIGESIPDWKDITNPYRDVCSAVDGNHMHKYSSAWNYALNPGKTTQSGGYAGTWFSKDILLAYQYGLIKGVDDAGTCGVGSYMTRAEICQMLYNANVLDTLYKYGNRYDNSQRMFAFLRDGKVYAFGNRSCIKYIGTYDPSEAPETDRGKNSIYGTVSGVDLRKQEWPTHPEFWTFRDGT